MTRSPLRLSPSLFLLRHMLPTRSCFTSPYRRLPICRTKAVCFRKHHLTLLLEQKANLLQAPAEVWGCEVRWKGTVVEFQCQAACWLVNQPSEPCQETCSFLSTSRRTTAPRLMAGMWNKTDLNGLSVFWMAKDWPEQSGCRSSSSCLCWCVRGLQRFRCLGSSVSLAECLWM